MHSPSQLWIPPAEACLRASSLPVDEPFTPAQAHEWGVSDAELRAFVTRGVLRRVVRGVMVNAEVPDTIESRAAALSLVVPESAVVTDRTAAWLHGVAILPRSARSVVPPLSMYQRSGTRVRRPGIDGGKRQLLDRDVTLVRGIRATTPLRTALDLGRILWRFDALAAMDGFVRIGVSKQQMLAEMDRFKGFRGVIQLRDLAPLADGRAESPGESALRLHWYDAGLPPPELQWWVYDDRGVPIYRLDIALPDCMFCAEYDGFEFHSEPEAVKHDVERRDWLANRRSWKIVVCRHENVYGQVPDATSRLAAAYNQIRGRSRT